MEDIIFCIKSFYEKPKLIDTDLVNELSKVISLLPVFFLMILRKGSYIIIRIKNLNP